MLPVYIDDLVEAILAGAAPRASPGQAYTVWDGDAGHLRRVLRPARRGGRRSAADARLPQPLLWALGAGTEAVARALRAPAAVRPPRRHLLDRRGTASNERAREELGWEPEVALDEGIRRSAEVGRK